MIESAIQATGILEETDDGHYYLTVRMSMMNYTSKQVFQTAPAGSDQWSNPRLGVTGTGTDRNGITKDICIELPAKNALIKGSMFVKPMGRSVVYFFSAGDFKKGNSTSMKATMVTVASAGKKKSEPVKKDPKKKDAKKEGYASAEVGK